MQSIITTGLGIIVLWFFFRGGLKNSNAEVLEHKIHHRVNQQRKHYGLKILELKSDVSHVARKHSQDMASKKYLAHKNKSGKSHAERLSDDNINMGRASAENIAYGSIVEYITNPGNKKHYKSMDTLADEIVSGWMKSKGHKENIIYPDFTATGIGVASGTDSETYYFTQVFVGD